MKSKELESKILHNGKLVSLKLDTVRTSSGKLKHYESIIHPGAIVVIPFTEKDELIFVKQYRHSAAQSLIEFPAGTLEADEDPFLCAQRELQEEIGMKAEEMNLMGGFFSTPGFCNEYIYVFLAKNLAPSILIAEDTEEIETFKIKRDEAHSMILEHQIIDAKTICCLYYLEKWLSS